MACKCHKFSVTSYLLVPSCGPRATPMPKRQSFFHQGATPVRAILACSTGTFHRRTTLQPQQIDKAWYHTCRCSSKQESCVGERHQPSIRLGLSDLVCHVWTETRCHSRHKGWARRLSTCLAIPVQEDFCHPFRGILHSERLTSLLSAWSIMRHSIS